MTDIPPESPRVIEALRMGYGLLTGREKSEGWWLSLAVAVVSILDIVSIMSVMPLVTLIVEPTSLEANQSFRQLHELIGSPPFDVLILWLAAAAGLLLTVATVARFATEYWLQSFGARAASRLANDMMRECLVASYAWHLTQNAVILTRMFFGDIQIWGSDFTQRIIMVLQRLIILTLSIAVITYAARLAGLVAMAVVLTLALGLILAARPTIRRMAAEQRAKSDTIVTTASQCFSGIKDIKMSSREAYFIDLYADAFRRFSRTRMWLTIAKQIPPILMVFFGQISLIMVAVVLWKLGLSAGEIAANMALLVLVSSRLVPSLTRITGDATTFWSTLPYIDRLGKLRLAIRENLTEGEVATLERPEPLDWSEIRIEDLTYSYGRDKAPALDAISLRMSRNKAYGIAGPSGAGKSTLVDVLLGLLNPTAGVVSLDGRGLQDLDIRRWQRSIGYVPQQPFIADESLRANVAFGVPPAEIDDHRVWHCLELANIREFCETLDQGLETVLGDQGKRLSGGQRQRIAIARALYSEPELLVLDEATSSLDTVGEDAIKQAILSLRNEITTLTIAHRLTTIRHCDQVFLLDQGKLVDSGCFEDILSRNALFQRLVASGTVSQNAEALDYSATGS